MDCEIAEAGLDAMTVAVNGRALGEIELAREAWRTYSLSVPATAVKSGINMVRFTYGYVAAPRDVVPESPDSRELSVAFSRITLKRN